MADISGNPGVIPLGAQAYGATQPEVAPLDIQSLLDIEIKPDGGVIVRQEQPEPEDESHADFNENLAIDGISGSALGMIATDILEGIEADLRSRQKFISNYTTGMDLLGLEIQQSSNTKAQKRNVSRVNHPVLLEATVRAQSMARAELLPATGPCKVSTDGDDSGPEDLLAADLQDDMNHYLTVTAREYIPEMDRGLFWLFFSGNLFKKVYTCPIRRRPVASVIAVEDLIVSEDATDLDTAVRVTHRSFLARPQVKRMQAAGVWREVDLESVAMPDMDPVKRKEAMLSGIVPVPTRPQDTPRQIYECTTDLAPADYGFEEKGAPDNVPLPYVVTVDRDTRTVLALRRGWKQGDPNYQRRQRFVHYCMVPGFGFLAYGYVHLLGNQTKALTAAWRLLCDAGMFANFPGGLKVKGVRTGSNELQPSPGEFVDVDVGPFDDITKAIMPMPYKDPSPVFIQFMEQIGQDAQRMAGAIEMEVGEGRANVPVGTIMTMIEQQTQVMTAVHKRLHSAQARELQLLREEFAENPETLSKLNPDPKRHWRTAEEILNPKLVPASDPNVPAQMHRIMRATALVMLSSSAPPGLYNLYDVHLRALESMGIRDVDSILNDPAKAPQQAAPQMPPQAMALIAGKQQEGKLKLAAIQADMQETAAKNQIEKQKIGAELRNDHLDRQSDREVAMMKQQTDNQKLALETEKLRLQGAGGVMGSGEKPSPEAA